MAARNDLVCFEGLETWFKKQLPSQLSGRRRHTRLDYAVGNYDELKIRHGGPSENEVDGYDKGCDERRWRLRSMSSRQDYDTPDIAVMTTRTTTMMPSHGGCSGDNYL